MGAGEGRGERGEVRRAGRRGGEGLVWEPAQPTPSTLHPPPQLAGWSQAQPPMGVQERHLTRSAGLVGWNVCQDAGVHDLPEHPWYSTQ